MAGEDREYTDRVKRLPCCGPKCMWQRGKQEAHHHRHMGVGAGKKAHDHFSMPLCLLCHHDFHAVAGEFKGWTREQLTKWQDDQVRRTQAALAHDSRCKGACWDGVPLFESKPPDLRQRLLSGEWIVREDEETF